MQEYLGKFLDTEIGKIYYVESGEQSRKIAILWPSLFTDHNMWANQIKALNLVGWLTLAVDPPGHGLSPGPKCSFSIEACATVIETIMSKYPTADEVLFVGVSWGGFVGLSLASRLQEKFKGMVLFNTSAEVEHSVAPFLLKQLFDLPIPLGIADKVAISKMLSAQTLTDKPDLVNNLVEQLKSWRRFGISNAIQSVLIERKPVNSLLTEITIPLLLVSGEEDKLLPPRCSDYIARKVVNSSHICVAGAAHLLPLEKPVITNEIILSFIGSNFEPARVAPSGLQFSQS